MGGPEGRSPPGGGVDSGGGVDRDGGVDRGGTTRPGVRLPHRAHLSPGLLEAIAREVGTPAYVYDARALDEGVERWTRAAPPRQVWYAVKANQNLAVLRRIAGHGLGFEAATPGELARVRAVGVGPDRLMLGGAPKRPDELTDALAAGLELVTLQAESEVDVAVGSGDPDRPAAVGLRVRPGIRAGAHPALETGVAEAKFGLAPEAALEAWRRLSDAPGLRPRVLSVHLGSGVESPEPYERAMDLLLDLAGEAERRGARVEGLDLGGGLAVDYEGGCDPEPAALVERVTGRLRRRGGDSPELRWEPGRSIVARMGVLLTRVLYRREREAGPAVVCDAAFTDFARHVLYGARHAVEPVGRDAGGPARADLLGATCESGDVLGTGLPLMDAAPGDLLAVRDVGAYGFAMASNYNGRPRPSEVMVEDGAWRVVRRREALADLWRGEEA